MEENKNTLEEKIESTYEYIIIAVMLILLILGSMVYLKKKNNLIFKQLANQQITNNIK